MEFLQIFILSNKIPAGKISVFESNQNVRKNFFESSNYLVINIFRNMKLN
jgi:hypothetical protein